MQFFSERSIRGSVISVSELTRMAKGAIEHALPLMWIAGEITNCTRAASGHCYFSLKDSNAQVRCVMFRHKSQFMDWQPVNGMQVDVRAAPTLYEARGEFQLNVEVMRRSGSGALYEAFERLKAKLELEGLFEPARKRALPPFPRCIGIVTSPAGAALHDVIITLRRRIPWVGIVIYPAPVQGAGAAEKLAAAINIASRRAECDLLIVCRGGGSIEDLWAFNAEVVARAIHACCLPIISGVGHETDFTIADFVADLRAPTPTGAAQCAGPDVLELLARVARARALLARSFMRALEDRMQQIDRLSRRLKHPAQRLADRFVHLGHLRSRLASAQRRAVDGHMWRLESLQRRMAARVPDIAALSARPQLLVGRAHAALAHALDRHGRRLAHLKSNLDHLNPQSVLERGYSIARTPSGEIVRDSAGIATGDGLVVTLARGWAATRVTDKG
jgi:exodeoxyribonuclease VII large subunit